MITVNFVPGKKLGNNPVNRISVGKVLNRSLEIAIGGRQNLDCQLCSRFSVDSHPLTLDCQDKMDLRLRISAGTSLDSMVSVDSAVDTGMPHKLTSDVFEGWIVAYIKDFVDEDGNMRESEYFSRKDRRGITWSLQVQGLCAFL